jgi:hypothetical protein
MEFKFLTQRYCPVCSHLSPLPGKKKDLNRLYQIMMSYDYSGLEWKRYEFVDENVSFDSEGS